MLKLIKYFSFKFILLFLYKVATGQLKEITDTRESNDEDEDKKESSGVENKKKN